MFRKILILKISKKKTQFEIKKLNVTQDLLFKNVYITIYSFLEAIIFDTLVIEIGQ
jgi:hypothetical protein